jgi:hypothetical protein
MPSNPEEFEPQTVIPADEFLTFEEAARRVPASAARLRKMAKAGIIRSVIVCDRTYLIESDLKHAFGSRYKPPAPPSS